MRSLLLPAALVLLAVPLASAGGPITIPAPSPWGHHYVGPCDYWSSPYNVGDSYRLTCVVDGEQILYFHQGSAALQQECDYVVLGHDLFNCELPPASA
jgi:hypothetical protein